MYDEEYEKAMLYYLIFDGVDYLLDEDDFVGTKNKQLIKAINELKAEKKDIDMLSVKAKIKENGEKILEYLSNLVSYSYGTTPENVYNKIIELSKKRKMLDILQKSLEEIHDVEEIDTFSEKTIKAINNIQRINEKEKTFLEQVVSATQEIEEKTTKETDYSLYMNMQELDKMLCGLHKKELTIIGARPRSW